MGKHMKREEKPVKSIYWCEYKKYYVPARKAYMCCQVKKKCKGLTILGKKID